MEAVELIVAVFGRSGRADDALKALSTMEKQRLIRLFNVAVIDKDARGHTRLKEKRDLDPGHGAIFGAAIGALIGILGGPAGVIVGAAAGAATGGVTASKVDLGFSDDFLKELEGSLNPDHSAILAIIEQQWVDQAVEVLKAHHGHVSAHALRDDLLKQISDLQDE